MIYAILGLTVAVFCLSYYLLCRLVIAENSLKDLREAVAVSNLKIAATVEAQWKLVGETTAKALNRFRGEIDELRIENEKIHGKYLALKVHYRPRGKGITDKAARRRR